MRARIAVATAVLVGSVGLAAAADELPGVTFPVPKGNVTAFAIPGAEPWVMVRTQGSPPGPHTPKGGAPAPKAAGTGLDADELDKRVARIMYETAYVGTDLWQRENYEGTFRLYQVALSAAAQLLDHRPKLAAQAQAALTKSASMKAADGAFVLREVIDTVQKETAVALMPKPLWDRLGGEKAVRAVVKDFVDLAAKDPTTRLVKGTGKPEAKDLDRLEQAVLEAISQQTGGPLKPTEGAGLKDVLAGTKLTYLELVALKTHLKAAVGKHKIPNAERRELEDVLGKLQNQILGQ